ncbi:aspartate kinase [Candidatus Bathyarchaeota archaeon]|nr:aspartate kinase [Candidatus Bathyarchaeota archaeon]MBS7617571.1 aspartate kinase [Candidatus Bathyarchaeota archaeon]
MKFGGTSLGDAASVKHVAGLIRKYVQTGYQVVVVSSASSGVTDELLNMCEWSLKDEKLIADRVNALFEKHLYMAEMSIENCGWLNSVLEILNSSKRELEKLLYGIHYVKEITPRIRDYVASFGEVMSTPILWGCLSSVGVKAEWLTGWDAGIVTDSNYGEAKPFIELSKLQLRNKLQPMIDRGIIPVVTGYIAKSQDGSITTLGRGGSDYTATLIAAALKADEVWLWTDVDGLMTADPKIEPSAGTIKELSFEEAVEMAILGAKRMHPRALEPAIADNIAVRIRNTFNPDNPGTLITSKPTEGGDVVKAVTVTRDVGLINVQGFGMVGTPGTAAKIFQILGKANINIMMIAQTVSESNISMVVPRKTLMKAVSLLETTLLGTDLVRSISYESDIAVVAAIGSGMRGKPGTAARIFKAVADEGVNVRMIAQGSSELNISIVVKDDDCEKAVRAIHKAFHLGR